jgi:hypothetical protein
VIDQEYSNIGMSESSHVRCEPFPASFPFFLFSSFSRSWSEQRAEALDRCATADVLDDDCSSTASLHGSDLEASSFDELSDESL